MPGRRGRLLPTGDEIIHRQHDGLVAVREHLALSHGRKSPATVDKRLENSCLAGTGRYPKMLLQHFARDVASHLPAAVRQHKKLRFDRPV